MPFPWEDTTGILTQQMGQCCIASYMSAPVLPDAMPCDGLLSQAMKMSSADESRWAKTPQAFVPGSSTARSITFRQLCASTPTLP